MSELPVLGRCVSPDGMLQVGGIPLDRLAARVGSTPFFAYDRAALTTRVAALRAALPEDVKLSYAVKANPMPAVVQHLSGLVDGFDVASAFEMRTALDTGVAAANVSFAGPGKTREELHQAVAAGVTIELESLGQAEIVTEAGQQLGLTPRCAVRVNPDFAVKGSGMRMGGGAQPFGVDSECVPALMKTLARRDLDVVGFHVFAGSQNLHAEVLGEAQRKTVELVLRLAEAAPQPVRYVNLGGGFGIPYSNKDRSLDLSVVGANLAELMSTMLRPQLPEARVAIELGRYIVGECGVYVTRVVDRKVSRGRTYLVVDGGMHHQLAASGNLGQVIRKNYPIAVGNRMISASDQSTNVVGCLCTPLDVLADNVELPKSDIGDLVVVFQAGAYGLTASPVLFLGHPTPVEVVV